MIKVTAKYDARKKDVMTDVSGQKMCSIEAIAIICEMYKAILKNQPELTEEKLQELLKEAYSDYKKEN